MSRLLNPVYGDRENLDFPFSLVSKIGQPQFTQHVNATAHASAATSKLAPARGSPPTWRQP